MLYFAHTIWWKENHFYILQKVSVLGMSSTLIRKEQSLRRRFFISKCISLITNFHLSVRWNDWQIRKYQNTYCLCNCLCKNTITFLVPQNGEYWRTLVIGQVSDLRFLVDLKVLGSGESKKHKISMVSRCSLVC